MAEPTTQVPHRSWIVDEHVERRKGWSDAVRDDWQRTVAKRVP